MKKEVFFAVIVGFVLGLIITFGIWTANRNLKTDSHGKNTMTESNTPTPSPSSPQPTSSTSLPLNITSPDDESLVSTSLLTVSGKTSPHVSVAIRYESGEKIISSDDSGNFSLDINLEAGYNRINVTAVDSTGSSSSAQLLVTYTTQKI